MKEIEWVANVQLSAPQLKYYYMGFYIHDCVKMKYKVLQHRNTTQHNATQQMGA